MLHLTTTHIYTYTTHYNIHTHTHTHMQAYYDSAGNAGWPSILFVVLRSLRILTLTSSCCILLLHRSTSRTARALGSHACSSGGASSSHVSSSASLKAKPKHADLEARTYTRETALVNTNLGGGGAGAWGGAEPGNGGGYGAYDRPENVSGIHTYIL